jgi:HSP20 family protein
VNKRRIAMENGKQNNKPAVNYDPWKAPWPREIQRFLDHAWIPSGAIRRWRRPWMPDEWMPDMDIFEREGKFVVRADLPGMKREDIQVRVEGETLVIHGHRQEETEVDEKDYHHSERRTGTFTRTLALPDGFNPGAIEATYKDGVLEVTVPRPTVTNQDPITVEVK